MSIKAPTKILDVLDAIQTMKDMTLMYGQAWLEMTMVDGRVNYRVLINPPEDLK